MVAPGTTCLGVEYFCFEGDEIWELPDEQAISLAKDELARIGHAFHPADGVHQRDQRMGLPAAELRSQAHDGRQRALPVQSLAHLPRLPASRM